MPGLRLILIALFVWIVWLFVKNAYRKQMVKKRDAVADEKSVPDNKIVKCAVCGVHVPQNEALVADGKFFCSEAHRREYH